MEARRFLTSMFLVVMVVISGVLWAGEIRVTLASDGLYLNPGVTFDLVQVTVTGPEGAVARKTFRNGVSLFFSLSEFNGQLLIDGTYTYEATLIRDGEDQAVEDAEENPAGGYLRFDKDLVVKRSGYFRVRGGMIDTAKPDMEPGTKSSQPQPQVNENLYISGRMGVGDAIVNWQGIPFEAVLLHQNNCQIKFDDSSTSTGYPSNDWKVRANDTQYGGANLFAIDDLTNGTTPFTLLADAPDHSIYVDAQGEVGFGTSTPAANLHVKDSTSALLNLESVAYSQIWQLSGTSNFVLRDVSNGSNETFVVAEGAPEYSFSIGSSGNIGFGTLFPAYTMQLIRSGSDPVFHIERSGGAQLQMLADEDAVYVGSKSDDPFHLFSGGEKVMTIDNGNVGIGVSSPAQRLQMAGGAYCNGATWVSSSSRALKENVTALTGEEAVETLKGLDPVKFKYKDIEGEDFIGFIAEDVPKAVAMKDRKSLSTMDIVAVLTKVVQQQQESLEEQRKQIEALKAEISKIKKK
jgi:flagellin-like hook-associated protein FlgL